MNPNLYNNKYRIESARLKHWNYGNNAAYFVTICTRNRENFFGNIPDREMVLSEIGRKAEEYWLEIPDNFPFVILDEHIVMPNHVHGIIIIDKFGGHADSGEVVKPDLINQDAINRVSTAVNADGVENRQRGGITGDNNPMIYENLSRILRWYKGRVTFESRKIERNFSWQPRFHDHIIRDERSFERIRNYINTNPSKWEEDKFYNK